MKVIDPGHHYRLDILDGPDTPGVVWGADLRFVKREGPGYPGNVGHHEGTNMQEVLRALIDRVKYLDNQIPHEENAEVLADLRHAIFALECRAAERHGRAKPNGWWRIEERPTCSRCGHIGCVGDCHKETS
jgi:hypothetical protein